MEQCPLDSALGKFFCLQEGGSLKKTIEFIRAVYDSFCEIPGDIQVTAKAVCIFF